MTDMQAHARKIRSDAAECMMLSNLVSEDSRHVFARIAEHLNSLALEIETEAATNVADEPAPAPNQQVDVTAHHAAPIKEAARSRRQRPWSLFVVVVLVIAGAVFWTMSRTEMQSFSLANLLSRTAPASRDSNRELVSLLSGERGERKAFGEQLDALMARLDSIARDLDDLKSFRAGAFVPSSKEVAGQDRSNGTEAKLPAGEQMAPRTETSRPSTETSVAATAGPSSATANSVGEPSATVSPIEAELDPPKPPIGPVGCTHFRSFDPVSGTYTTFDGRRRQCR